ncbi:MAG: phage tail terminator protein [Stenotrophomonas sp.]|uniref:phage tail terminator protein n=1 Tax=Stenotrophomonas sp. TaxID=69392 RepID=UPI003D6D2268
MSAAPFDVRVVQDRLRTSVKALRSVEGSADFQSITSLQDFPAPCAYVVLAREKGQPNEPGHAPRGQMAEVRQIMVVTFAVVLAVRNYREQRGAQVADDLSSMLSATRGVLIGWVPDVRGARACQLLQGDIQDYDAGTALWADVYQTQHSIGGAKT